MTDNKRLKIVTPVGRLVTGSVFSPFPNKGEKKYFESGPSKGEERHEYLIRVAFPKAAPVTEKEKQLAQAAQESFHKPMSDAAIAGFPTLFKDGVSMHPQFSWKLDDGDSKIARTVGAPAPCERDGWPGNWIYTFKSFFKPKCIDQTGSDISDKPELIKCGYYVRVSGTTSANNNQNNPGIYLNIDYVQLCGHGELIAFGSSAQAPGAFSADELPAFASSIPVSPVGAAGIPPTANNILMNQAV